MANWLGLVDVPLFVSHRRLATRKTYPRALGSWALDSGGFTELSMHGRWVTTSRDYARAVLRYQNEIGQLEWCAPQDWMCEPFMLAKTGLNIKEHQERTIDSYCILASHGLPVIPVLQGWDLADYHDHVDQYEQAGIVLEDELLVGLGSVCRRQHTNEIARITWSLADRGLSLHGFGVKTRGLSAYHDALASCDSLAWSYAARRQPPLPGHEARHQSCANCLDFAMTWRWDLLERVTPTQTRMVLA